MRRTIATAAVTLIAVLAPATAAHAEPAPPDPPTVQVQVYWPVCVLVLGTGVCIPP